MVDALQPSADPASNAALHRRLGAFYLFFYAQLGAMLPYWGLWLSWRGFSAEQIGGVFGVLGGSRLIVPVLWGWLADRTGGRMRVIRIGSLCALVAFALLSGVETYAGLLLLTLVFALFWHAVMPQFEVITLDHLQNTGLDYPRVRMWGSVGFVCAVLALGPFFDRYSLGWLPWIGVLLIAGMAASSFLVRAAPHVDDEGADGPSIWTVLRRPTVVGLLLICFLSQFSFAPYYGFFSLYLQDHGYARSVIGGLWALGVLAEIWVFVYAGGLLRRFGARNVMLLAMAATALRWGALPAFVGSLPALIALQVLHLASFGLYHVCAIHFIQREFKGRLHGRGQALYSAVSFGAGGAIGSVIAGTLWDGIGADAAYYLAAAAGVVAVLVGQRFLEAESRTA